MIRHLVLFKLNDGVSRDEPRVAAGVEAFRALGEKIPELTFWECGWNVTDRPIAYDFVINSVTFWECGWNVTDRPIAYDFAINSAVEDPDALKRYLEHPAHQEGVAMWREFATWVIADYEF